MAKLTFHCAVPCAVFVDGTDFSAKPHIAAPTGKVVISVLPALTEGTYLAYTVLLTLDNDRITSITGGAQAVEWGCGEYDVLLRPPRLPIRHTPVTLCQSGDKTFATLYDDGEMHLMCEGSFFLVRDVPRLVSYNLSSSCNGEFIALLSGRTATKSYLLAVSDADGGRVVHEHLADDVQITETGVVVHERLWDMLQRTKTSTYNASGLEHCSFLRVERDFPRALVPYALAEALLCHDDEWALQHLAPDLADADGVRAFMGEWDELCQPRGAYPDHALAVYKRGEGITRPRVFEFDVDGTVVRAVREISIS